MHAILIFCRKVDVAICLTPIHTLHVRIEILGQRTNLLIRKSHQIELGIYHTRNLSLLYILSDTTECLRRTRNENALAIRRELGTIQEFTLLYQSLYTHIIEIETIVGIKSSWTLGKTFLALADEQIAGICRNIAEIDVVIAESERLENTRRQIKLGKITTASPSWLTVIRLLHIIHLRIFLSALGIKSVDKRLLIGSKLEPSVWNIGSQHFALHIERIDGDELQLAICLAFAGNRAVARLLGKVHLVGTRHPSYALFERSYHLVGLTVSQFVDAMILALSIYPSLAHNHKLAVRRHLNTCIVRHADYIIYTECALGAGSRFTYAELLAIGCGNADLEILVR